MQLAKVGRTRMDCAFILADPFALQAHKDWSLAVIDLFIKEGSGLGILSALQGRRPTQRAVVLSNYATREMRHRCAALGADEVFDKSTELDLFLDYCIGLSTAAH